MRKRTPALFLAVVFAFASLPANAAPFLASDPAVSTQLDTSLERFVGDGKEQTPSLGIAIVQDGKISYARDFGTASADTPFHIASVTKMFTAVSIMQLVAEHKLTLDESVASILPSAPYADKITVRQLLNHTSGLWNYLDSAIALGTARTPTTPQAILKLVAAHPLTSTPGTQFTYSNSGYVVLGQIVEKLSGESLAAYEREHIFAPAGMLHTTSGAHGPVSKSYDASWLYADGDIVSTPTDLARFDLALMNASLLPAPFFEEMQSMTVATPQSSVRWGLGVTVITQGDMRFIGHHGGLPDAATENEMVPDQKMAMVVLSTSADFNTSRVNAAILRTLDPRLVAEVQAQASVTPEDPAITARFRNALASLLQGKVDRREYSDTVNSELTPATLQSMAKQLAPLGTITKVAYVGAQPSAVAEQYFYDVTFGNGDTIRWEMVLTPDGKIASLLIRRKP